MRRLIAILCLLLASGTAQTGIIHVPGDSLSIQSAIRGASDGDTVLVAPGVYAEQIDFLGKRVTVAGIFLLTGDSGSIDSTVISGANPVHPDSGSVVTFSSGEDTNACLVGFTITGGTGTVSPWSGGARVGGGILCVGDVSPRIDHNHIRGNELAGDSAAGAGIGIYGNGADLSTAAPRVTNNLLEDNRAGGGGVAIDLRNASAWIAGNGMTGNAGRADMSATVRLWRANANIVHNTFAANALDCIHIPSDTVACSLSVRDNIFRRTDTLSPNRYAIANQAAVSFVDIAHNCFAGSFTEFFVAVPDSGLIDTTYTNGNGTVCDRFFNLYRDPALCRQGDLTVSDTSVCIGAASDSTVIGARGIGCYAHAGPVWHVDTAGNDFTGDGSSQYPFRSLRRAMTACSEGDTVLIHDGTYTGPENTEIAFAGMNLVLMSEHGPETTIIDATHQTVRALVIEEGQDTTTVVRGLRITNADIGLWVVGAPRLIDVQLVGNQTGLYVVSGEPRLDSARIEDNRRGVWLDFGSRVIARECSFAADSTGLLCAGGAQADLRACTVVGCTTGLAAEFDHSRLSCSNCQFTDNAAAIEAFHGVADALVDSSLFVGNGVAIRGACDLTRSTVRDGRCGVVKQFLHCARLTDCLIENLDTALIGIGAKAITRADRYHIPGFHLAHTSITGCREIGVLTGGLDGDEEFLELDTCRLENNSGGIVAEYCGLSMIDCLYVRNGLPLSLDIRLEQSWTTEIIGCTFAANADDALRLSHIEGPPALLHRTLIAHTGGTGLLYSGPEDKISVTCCDVFGNLGGDVSGLDIFSGAGGNVSADPVFCDTASGDYSVYSFSPCAPANSSCGLLIGAAPADCPPPEVTQVTVDSLANNRHLLSTNPVFAWSYQDSTGRAQSRWELEVGLDSDWTTAEMWRPGVVESTDSTVVYSGDSLTDGQTYFLRLRVGNPLVWSQWFHTDFATNAPPPVPLALWPIDALVTGPTPTLWVRNSLDADGDSLRYDFSGFADTGCTAGVEFDTIGIPETPDSTGVTVDLSAAENCRHWWRARAGDGYEYSSWTSYSTFAVNGISEPPSTPRAVYPPDTTGRPVYDMIPEYRWTASVDPDPSDTVRYRLEVALDSNFLAAAVRDSLVGTSLRSPDSLAFNAHYWWRVTAFDLLALSATSDVSTFWSWTLGDLDHDHEVTTGDLTIMIDHLFILLTPLSPMKAGDLDGDCLVTMGDLTVLIDHLYITLSPITTPGCG